MADEVVKIRVEQEGSGTALRDAQAQMAAIRKEVDAQNPDTVARRDRLYKAAGAYEEKGDFVAAKSARQDALRFEGDLVRLTKERYNAHRAATQEHREQLALARAAERAAEQRMARIAGVARGVEHVAGQATGGAGGLLGDAMALGSKAGPIGTIIGAVVGIVGAVYAVKEGRAHKEQMSAVEDAIESRGAERGRARLLGPDGGAGASRSAAEEALDDRLRREDERTKLELEATPRISDPTSLWRKITGESEKTIRDNELAIERDKRMEGEHRADATGQFKIEGGLEMEAKERRLNWDPRGARDVEHMLLFRREYNRLVKEGADAEQAEHGGRLAVGEAVRHENMAAARLVGSRSGARDIARAANIARGEIGGRHDPAIAQRMEELIATVKANHIDALNRRPHNMGRPPQ